jgi:hypothetical protein
MDLQTRIKCFTELGMILKNFSQEKFGNRVLSDAINRSFYENPWFTEKNISTALNAVADWLEPEKLEKWVTDYPQLEQSYKVVNVGVIMAGNIPAVGFHDFLTVLISGNRFIGKLSSDDKYIIPALAVLLKNIEPEFENLISFTEDKLHDFDAVIATGSNNSSRYFEYYFAKYPNIIRRNRNSLAVLTGNESKEDYFLLGKDIYHYFGLGCRNVSTLFVKRDFDFVKLFDALMPYSSVNDNNKYINNYNYYKTIFSMNTKPFMDNGFSLFREEDSLLAPVSVINYKFYDDISEVIDQININTDKIQCVIGKDGVVPSSIPFGKSQNPELWDYADGVDTMKFLLSIRKS